MKRHLAWVIGIAWLVGGCATEHAAQLAALPEAMCKHCNCLMPAGLDREATCPVCKCGRRVRQCVRGR